MIMTSQHSGQPDQQYSLKKILIIWALSAIPMGVLAFVITPRLVAVTNWSPLIVYWIAVIIGLIWQFILSLIILKHDKDYSNEELAAITGSTVGSVKSRLFRAKQALLQRRENEFGKESMGAIAGECQPSVGA